MSSLYVGLMSGTSLDGVDAALVDLQTSPRLIASRYAPFPDDLRNELLALNTTGPDELQRASRASVQLAAIYAEATLALLKEAGVAPAAIAAIGCHGQTVRHVPAEGYTLQLNNPALLAERTGITVVADFRSRDIAAGGQGAPLVPAFHAACFRHASRTRVVLNIGGIANVTLLPADASLPVLGFDTGPGNLLLDAWAAKHLGKTHDAGGAWAASGKVSEVLLAAFLADPYFSSRPPKSTGRDHFNMPWLLRHAPENHRAEDVQATLAELTAQSIADAISRWCPGGMEVHACGGGAHNTDLMARLAAALKGLPLHTTEALDLHPDWVEAVAFAWLARETMKGRPGNLPAVTGALGPRVLGAIYPA